MPEIMLCRIIMFFAVSWGLRLSVQPAGKDPEPGASVEALVSAGG